MKQIITKSLIAVSILSSISIANIAKVSDVEAQYSAQSTLESTKDLKQSINLGFSNTTGNTETLNINGKYTMAFMTQDELKVGFDASAFMTENKSVKENEEYTVNLGLEQMIVDDWLGYASFSWLRNEFRNFDHKLAVGAGVGKEVFNDGQHVLKVKLGLAYNLEKYSNDQEDHRYSSLNEYLEYTNKLNAISDLYVKIGASQHLDDFSNYEVLAAAGFNFSVAENLSVSIEEEISYDRVPPVGFDKTDTKTIVRVGYNF